MSENTSLDQQKKDRLVIEKQVMTMFVKRENEIQKRFESALAMEFLTDIQGQNDTQIILTKLSDWHNKAKNKTQKDTLMELIQCLFRVQTYVEQKAILAKKATAEYITYKNENKTLNDDNSQLRKNIKSLKKLNEYYEKEEKKETD